MMSAGWLVLAITAVVVLGIALGIAVVVTQMKGY